MKLKKLFVVLLMINIFALIGVVLIFDDYQKATKKLQYAYDLQHKSLILADELRQSSDDLTRMARTYVVTGKDMFEKQFHQVLDIRNGVINRPLNYNRIYWDFLTLEHNKPLFNGEKKSLRMLMQESGFPDTEIELLFKSAEQSDNLTYLETKAMNAVKGIFQDEKGDYTIKGKPDLQLAANIMHGDEYHKAKIEIMKPLDQFYIAFELRTQMLVDESNIRVEKLGKYLSGAIFLLMFLVLFSFFILLSRIIHPLEALKNSMLQLADNDMDTKLPSHELNDEVGDMIGSVKIFKENAIRLFQKEEKLKVAIKAAKAANHSKSIFLANMSHELRTPLNAILGFTSILKKSINVSQQEKANLTVIQSSGNHLLSIINEILELSKIEVGKIDIINQEFDFFEMIEDVKRMFDSRCQNKKITLSIEIDKNVSKYIVCDQQRVKQILINIIGNSLKFTKEGFIKCKISIVNNKLHFEIEDSGIGISSENSELIFKQFEQIKTDKNTNSGTGLGLSITKELVKLLGGKIKVKSELGVGTIFSFYITYKPIIKNEIVEQRKNTDTSHVTFTKDTTILIADDIVENRELLKQLLTQHDVNILEAKDGLEVLEQLEKHTINMILLDILMPNLNGYDTMSKIAKNEKYQNIPIIVVSANVFKEDRQKAISLGAKEFLAKPVNEDELSKILETYLKKTVTKDKQKIDKEIKIELEDEFKQELEKFIKRLDGNGILELLELYNVPQSLKNDIINKVKSFRYNEISV